MSAVRTPAVSGTFYPEDALACLNQVHEFLTQAEPAPRKSRAIIAPHAGYIYSGPIAGSAYRALPSTPPPDLRVIIVGPSHTMRFPGIAAPAAESFATPMGEIPVDRDAIDTLQADHLVVVDDDPHLREHGIEVQLPFLQHRFGSLRILPLVTGECRAEQVAEILLRFIKDPTTFIVISSDLSHYASYEHAQVLDRDTARMIEQGDGARLQAENACGYRAIQGLLLAQEQTRWRGKTLDLRNSGDTAGTRDRVVGYGAFSFA